MKSDHFFVCFDILSPDVSDKEEKQDIQNPAREVSTSATNNNLPEINWTVLLYSIYYQNVQRRNYNKLDVTGDTPSATPLG